MEDPIQQQQNINRIYTESLGGGQSSAKRNGTLTRDLHIKKISDVSFSKDGSRLYQVQWEETWEKEEVILKCFKHLLRDFWIYHVELEPHSTPHKKNPDEQIIKETSDATDIQPPQTYEDVKQTVEIPEHYKNVGFAQSVREKYGVDAENGNNFDFIEHVLTRTKQRKYKDFSRKPREDVIRHYVSYQNGTRVSCETCSLCFADKKSLLRHKVARHKKFSPHQCSVCLKMFMKPGDVRRHTVVHSDVRAHICAICSKSYKTQNHLRRHMKLKHNSDIIVEPPPNTNSIESVNGLADNTRLNASNVISDTINDAILHPVVLETSDSLLHATTLQTTNIVLSNQSLLTDHFILSSQNRYL